MYVEPEPLPAASVPLSLKPFDSISIGAPVVAELSASLVFGNKTLFVILKAFLLFLY